MARLERTGWRGGEAWFSRWWRDHLPDGKDGFTNENIDYCMRNYKKKRLLLLEVKHFGAHPDFAQIETYKIVNAALKIGLPKLGWVFQGTHLLRFEKGNFTDGRSWLDQVETSELQFIHTIEKLLDIDRGEINFNPVDKAIEESTKQ